MHPFYLCSSLVVALILVESTTSWIFIRRSRKRYPILWSDAGEPTLLGDGNLIRAWGTNHYLLKREYQHLSGPDGRYFAEKMRMPMLIGYFGGWISVLLFWLCILIYGTP